MTKYNASVLLPTYGMRHFPSIVEPMESFDFSRRKRGKKLQPIAENRIVVESSDGTMDDQLSLSGVPLYLERSTSSTDVAGMTSYRIKSHHRRCCGYFQVWRQTMTVTQSQLVQGESLVCLLLESHYLIAYQLLREACKILKVYSRKELIQQSQGIGEDLYLT